MTISNCTLDDFAQVFGNNACVIKEGDRVTSDQVGFAAEVLLGSEAEAGSGPRRVR